MIHIIALIFIFSLLGWLGYRKMPSIFRCSVCGIRTINPIWWDNRTFDVENCRALYEVGLHQMYEEWWKETGKDELGF